MTLAQKIYTHLEKLPDNYLAEILDFVQLLESKSKELDERQDEDREAWSQFSLTHAMRGMEDEGDLYSLDDLKEIF